MGGVAVGSDAVSRKALGVDRRKISSPVPLLLGARVMWAQAVGCTGRVTWCQVESLRANWSTSVVQRFPGEVAWAFRIELGEIESALIAHDSVAVTRLLSCTRTRMPVRCRLTYVTDCVRVIGTVDVDVLRAGV